MNRERYTAERIIGMLRQAVVALSQGQSVGQICRSLGVSEFGQTLKHLVRVELPGHLDG